MGPLDLGFLFDFLIFTPEGGGGPCYSMVLLPQHRRIKFAKITDLIRFRPIFPGMGVSGRKISR